MRPAGQFRVNFWEQATPTYRFNKGRSSKFCVGNRIQQTLEEGQRTYRPKRCWNNNKGEDNSLKTLNDKIQTPRTFQIFLNFFKTQILCTNRMWHKIHFYWLVCFYGISTIVGYLMSNPLYIYILNIYDFVELGFMVYQPLWVI